MPLEICFCIRFPSAVSDALNFRFHVWNCLLVRVPARLNHSLKDLSANVLTLLI